MRLLRTSRRTLFFFFFQAEDGIRDLTVTGVQTCALPISQSRSASSRRSNRATRASTSCVWCAMPSTRYGSYSRGLTNRRSRNPKFLSARTTWAMLTRSWGSWSTTTIIACPHKRASAECAIRNAEWQGEVRYRRAVHSALASSHQLQDPEPLRFLAIAPDKHPAIAAAPDQLPVASRASRQHLVHEQVEP